MDKIDDLKEELQQTQLAYQMAVQLNQFKTGFLARIAHELRSPLSSLIGLHQLILTDLCENPEEEREFLNQAYQSALKLMGIIDEIVTVSKLEYGSLTPNIQPLQVIKIFQDLYELTHLQAANRNLKLEILYPTEDLYILGDAQRLLQALVMLVDTGISHLETGKIQVSLDSISQPNLAIINLDFPCKATLWQDFQVLPATVTELNREAIQTLSQTIMMSPSMKFLLSKNILQAMKSNLNLLELPDNFTQMQCLLPLVPGAN